jgi:hypothetical protein
MEDFLKLHGGGEDYLMFTKEFLRIVVGKRTWKHNSFRTVLSSYCSASSEAFCLLTMENNYARWCSMIETEDYGDRGSTAPPPLYTNAGKSNRLNGKTKPFQGWTQEGYKRFDELYGIVKADRLKQSRLGFEEKLRKIIEEEEANKRQTNEAEEIDEGEVTYPSHDCDDVVQGMDMSHFSDDEEGGGAQENNNSDYTSQEEDDEENEDDDDEDDDQEHDEIDLNMEGNENDEF